ncbi:Vts1p NDAI_0A08740 [Naumovozyma dairenensis CBS 421]|uniref:RNA-binding protein VTS1 n=1 Tax=Naumovozyma dairenensis (strain ATCC 10597 / BCRC 20456 / CBS 421 / NBRC 0211 / NRRL Y-12639) TaxID=1071378 RepID=G0W5D9_NAUDC|nr:hypothetical protein NDAI_0A08740 [Naumovozyma dairenensis CBS 421]CCD23027.1 hypothetical protein NDAI_0A08740 [Naumovozyma dairenensis CBS 421]
MPNPFEDVQNSRPQSPGTAKNNNNTYNLNSTIPRGIHPGAVLLSPQSSSMSISNSTNRILLSPNVHENSSSLSMSFTDLLDQQPFMLDLPNRSTVSSPPLTMHDVSQQYNVPKTSSSNPTPNLNSITVGSTSLLSSPKPLPLPTTVENINDFINTQPSIPSATLKNSLQTSFDQTTNEPRISNHLNIPINNQSVSTINNNANNFNNDINQLCSWITLLTVSQQKQVLDNIFSVLSVEALQHLKLKLLTNSSNTVNGSNTSHRGSNKTTPNNSKIPNSPPHTHPHPQVPTIASPVPNRYPRSDIKHQRIDQVMNLDAIFSSHNNGTDNTGDSKFVERSPLQQQQQAQQNYQKGGHPSILYQQWSPPPISSSQPIYDYIKESRQRPKSAEPRVLMGNTSPSLSYSQESINNIMESSKNSILKGSLASLQNDLNANNTHSNNMATGSDNSINTKNITTNSNNNISYCKHDNNNNNNSNYSNLHTQPQTTSNYVQNYNNNNNNHVSNNISNSYQYQQYGNNQHSQFHPHHHRHNINSKHVNMNKNRPTSPLSSSTISTQIALETAPTASEDLAYRNISIYKNHNNNNNNNNNNNLDIYDMNYRHHNKLRTSNNNNNNNSSNSNNTMVDSSTENNNFNNTAINNSMNAKNLTDPRLLTNVPLWLKSLRLHKYSDILEKYSWLELIDLDDSTLENNGVSALGARRKLLKAFGIVKDYKERGLIDERAFI